MTLRAPLSYVPLLPWCLILVLAILIANPVGHSWPEAVVARGTCAVVERTVSVAYGQALVVTLPIAGHGRTKARLRVNTEAYTFEPGTIVRFSGRLSQSHPESPMEDDFGLIYRRQGIIYTGRIDCDSIRADGPASGLFYRLRRLQPKVTSLILQSPLTDEAGRFLVATIVGDASLIDRDVRQQFNAAGIAHVLALSGMHVAIVMTVIGMALWPLLLMRQRVLRIVLTLVLTWGFAIFTGLSASVMRATVMATAISGGVLLQRRYFGFNGLLLAAIVLLVADPLMLYQPGFQLSFLSVASILSVIPLVNRIPQIRRRWFRVLFWVLSGASVTLAATLGTGIVSAYYFHTVPLLFLPANLPVVAILPMIMGLGIMVVIVGAMGGDPYWFCVAVNKLYSLGHGYISTIASCDWASLSNVYLPGWVIAPYLIMLMLIVIAIYFPRYKGRLVIGATVCAVIAIVGIVRRPSVDDCDEIIATRPGRWTAAIYRHDNQAVMLTTATGQNALSLRDDEASRHKEWMSRHGIDSLLVVTDYDDTLRLGQLSHIRGVTTLNNKTYYTPSFRRQMPPREVKINYLVVECGFGGSLVKLCQEINPDTVLLGNGLSRQRHQHYIDSLSWSNISFRSLRTGSLKPQRHG